MSTNSEQDLDGIIAHTVLNLLATMFAILLAIELAVALDLPSVRELTTEAMIVGSLTWLIFGIFYQITRDLASWYWVLEIFCVILFAVSFIGIFIVEIRAFAQWSNIVSASGSLYVSVQLCLEER